VPYTGIPTWDQQLGAYVNKVSPDTSADALFHSTRGAVLRSVGTATIQQAFPEDGLNVAVMDELVVRHGAQNVLYQETGGGFIASQNRYKFTDIDPITGSTPTAAATNINRYNTQNIGFLNDSMVNTGAVNAGHLDGNLNDNTWDTATAAAPPTIAYQLFNQTGNVKNEFQRVLYDTIFELDQRNLLRDVFRLSEKNGFLTDIQIASTSSLVTGSQAQASIFLNFRPFYDGVTAGRAYRPDLGGNVDVIMDRFTAFYHSG